MVSAAQLTVIDDGPPRRWKTGQTLVGTVPYTGALASWEAMGKARLDTLGIRSQ